MTESIPHVEGEGWCATPFTCVICGYKCVSVHPVEAQKLECAKCGYMNDGPRVFVLEDEND